MGAHHSKHKDSHHQSSSSAHNGTSTYQHTTTTAQSTPSPQPVHYHPHAAPQKDVKLFGCPENMADDASQLLPMGLYSDLCDKIPPILSSTVPGSGGGVPRNWYLLFSSEIHGKSFNRMIGSISGRGPTIILITLSGTEKVTTSDGNRVACTAVIGGYNETSWAVVSDREKSGKSHAAAVARADRLGHDAPSGRPSNQSTQYFGDDRCFMFRADTWKDSTSNEWKHDNLRVYPSKRSSAKQNFMYLSDSHPDDSRIGIGMGGDTGSWAWFIDRWLEAGSCNQSVEGEPIQRCGTFHSLVLSPTMTWTISQVNAFAVEPGMVGKLREDRGDYTSAVMASNKTGVLDRADIAADKMILEMNNQHTFNDGVREEEGGCGRY